MKSGAHRSVIAIALLVWIPHASGAAELVLDGLSFFAFEGSGKSAPLPAGTVIPIEATRDGAGGWHLAIAASNLSLPPVTYPSGRSVTWKLSGDARGTLTVSGEEASLVLSAPLVAHVDGALDGIPFPMTFRTGMATASAAGVTASREGAKLDLRSGYVQLVAAGVNPRDAATAPGKPFYAVLSGQVRGLPTDLKAQGPPGGVSPD